MMSLMPHGIEASKRMSISGWADGSQGQALAARAADSYNLHMPPAAEANAHSGAHVPEPMSP